MNLVRMNVHTNTVLLWERILQKIKIVSQGVLNGKSERYEN